MTATHGNGRRWLGGWIALMPGLALMVVYGASAMRAEPLGPAPQEDPAVERAREQVQMLDALYKTAVVSITDKYQRGQPAIMVAKDVFEAMDKFGHHSPRLVDATGIPLGEGNDPETDFEKRAAAAMQRNETYVEEIVGEGPDRRLLAATVVPAVHQRCASCHAVEEGDLLGFIRYEIPIR
ncbi:hypothetical protein [Tautonia rosea]|uniref:hypothetical protein n=1 Tax=Tautonia rosea TaxID=2728037 RepID=UPI001475BC94|nr:hypothetical protein [Tautonia rosea]